MMIAISISPQNASISADDTSPQPSQSPLGMLRTRAMIQIAVISMTPARMPGNTPARNIRPTDTSVALA